MMVINMSKKRFYMKIENGSYQLYDREKEFSFNSSDDEFLITQVCDALNCLEYDGEYTPILFKLDINGEIIKLYQKEYDRGDSDD